MPAWSSHRPRSSSTCPACASAPRGTKFSPRLTPRRISTNFSPRVLHPRVPHPNVAFFATLGWELSAADVCSTITTASAPAGSGAPVMISTACPRPTEHTPGSGQSPAFTAPTTSSRAGTSAKSAARTAYPSRVARSNGGKSRSAKIPSASTRPKPVSRSAVSSSPGHTPPACFSTKRRASSKLITRADGTADDEEWEERDMPESYAANFAQRRKAGARVLI